MRPVLDQNQTDSEHIDMTEQEVARAAAQLADSVQLEDVVFFELSGRRLEDQETTEPGDLGLSGEFPMEIKIGQSDDLGRLIIRLVADVSSPHARFRVDVGAQYRLEEPAEVAPEVRIAFANQGPLATLIPFLRESLISTAARLKVPAPLVPLVRLQDLTASDAPLVGE